MHAAAATMTGSALVLLAACGFAFGPAYVTAADTLAAAARGDEAALARTVDFEALQADVSGDFREALDARFAAQGLEGPMADVAAALLEPLSDAAAAALASPEGLIAAAEEAQAPASGALGYAVAKGRPVGLSRFTLDLDDAAEPTRLVFTRAGLGWRLTGLDLPPDALGGAVPGDA